VLSTFGGAIEGILHYAPLQALVFNDQGLLFEALGPKRDFVEDQANLVGWDGRYPNERFHTQRRGMGRRA
jgi:hypothetical protein